MSKKKNWVAGAIKHPGALKRKAKAAGQTVGQYCRRPDLSPRARRQCNLAKTLKKF